MKFEAQQLKEDLRRSELQSVENVNIQNELTVITDLKPGWLPLLRLKLVLWFVELIARYGQPPIGGIATIHFFRWVIIDNGARLLFTSNYDGTWESYIEEFVDKTAWAMNAVWGNCVGFPEKGATDIENFKLYIKDHQLDADVFYRAYPTATVRNIQNDIQIRETIETVLKQKDVAEFLKRL
jgi:hypothetical protein